MMCQGEKLGDVFLMFGFFVFVFCGNVTDCRNGLYFRNGPPPAAACASNFDDASRWIQSLNASLTPAECFREQPQLSNHTFIAGADNDEGATLHVEERQEKMVGGQKKGWIIHVPWTKLKEVTSATIDGLIRMFAQAKEAYEKLSLPKPPVPTNSSSALTSEDEARLDNFAETINPKAPQEARAFIRNCLHTLASSVPGQEQKIVQIITKAPKEYKKYFSSQLKERFLNLKVVSQKLILKEYAELMIKHDRLLVVSRELLKQIAICHNQANQIKIIMGYYVTSFDTLFDVFSDAEKIVKELEIIDMKTRSSIDYSEALISSVPGQEQKIVQLITEAPENHKDYFIKYFRVNVLLYEKGIIDKPNQDQLKRYAEQMIQDGRLLVTSVEILLHALNFKVEGKPNYPCQSPPDDLTTIMQEAENLVESYVVSFNEFFRSPSAAITDEKWKELQKKHFHLKYVSQNYKNAHARHMETKVNPE